MSEISIRIEGLSKRYRIGQFEAYKTMRDTLCEAVYAPFRRLSHVLGRSLSNTGQPQTTDDQYVWALKDVSFDVRRGEVLGVIGPNGAGKTTLLKILSRITEPTEGYAEIRGRVGSLLEVGTGFHPELTGRENIYLSGAILGMKRTEIVRKFDEIADFSGVEKFLDTPVKRYSSGMYLRLAFAVAAHLDPEILLVDEVLAVGDAAFQQKCLGKMNEVARGGRTVLFVSHNMAAVRNLCSLALFIDKGQVAFAGAADEVIQRYLSDVRDITESWATSLVARNDRSGSGRIRVVSFESKSCGGKDNQLQTGSDAELTIQYEARENRPIVSLLVAISVMDTQGNNVFLCSTGMYYSDFRDVQPSGKIKCKIEELPLIPGQYWVNLLLKDDQGVADSVNKAYRLNVVDGGLCKIPQIPSNRWGSVIVPHEWEWSPNDVQE